MGETKFISEEEASFFPSAPDVFGEVFPAIVERVEVLGSEAKLSFESCLEGILALFGEVEASCEGESLFLLLPWHVCVDILDNENSLCSGELFRFFGKPESLEDVVFCALAPFKEINFL